MSATAPINNYCKLSGDEIVAAIATFMRDKSKLPNVSVSELTGHKVFADAFEEFVPERRRWMEITAALRSAGWESRRQRGMYFAPDSTYESRVTMRWFPPGANTRTPEDT